MIKGRLSLRIIRFDGEADIELEGLKFDSAIPSRGDNFWWLNPDNEGYELWEVIKSVEWFGTDAVQLNCETDKCLSRDTDSDPIWGTRPETLSEALEKYLENGWQLEGNRRTIWDAVFDTWVPPSRIESGRWLPEAMYT